MAAYTFNGATKRIQLPTGLTTLNLSDLYSRWKDWVLDGHAEYPLAFGTVGGEIDKIPLYLFCTNGWKIIPQAANHTLSITGGILETDDDTYPFVSPAGSYSIFIDRNSPGIAIGYSTTGGGEVPSDVLTVPTFLALKDA